MSSTDPAHSPPDQISNASQSHTGNESWNVPIHLNDYSPLDFNDRDQYFESLPHLRTPEPYLPEPSNSREQPPPSNQQARQQHISDNNSRHQASESPDPFDFFIDQSLLSPPPPQNPQAQDNTRTSSVVDLTESSPLHNNMPPKKRKAETAAGGRVVRQRTSTTPAKAARSITTPKQKDDDVTVVDLVEIENEEQYKELKAKEKADAIKQQQQDEANKPVKLADFECIICMEKPTDLTVTHCGHLFCSECLHQALYAGNGKKCCPVCRAPISTTGIGKGQKKQPKNGIFAVEMKLMTANKKGKQPVRGR